MANVIIEEERTAREPVRHEEVYGREERGPAARVFLQPIAAPSVLGLYAYAGATLMVGAYMAGWYGGVETPLYLLPFAAFFGGLAQFLSGMWAYKARDGLATAFHGMWGSFWMSYGLLYLMFATGTIALPLLQFPELGFWFIVLGWVTFMLMVAALGINWSMVGVLAPSTAASIIAAVALFFGSNALMIVAGWIFVFSAVVAWYAASAILFESVYGRAILPIFKTEHAKERPRISIGAGEPGVTHGQ